MIVSDPAPHNVNDFSDRIYFSEFQSLRGIAAIVVVLDHSIQYLDTPLTFRILASQVFNGHAAVVIFFIMSGFVLTNGWYDKPVTSSSTMTYALRRLFRIYPGLWFATCMGLAYYLTRRALPIDLSLADEFVRQFYDRSVTISLKTVVGSLAGYSNQLVPQSWTIFIELLGSALMPFIMLFSRKKIVLMIVITLIFGVFAFWHGAELRFTAGIYLFCFPLGALIYLVVRRRHIDLPYPNVVAAGGLAVLLAVRPLYGYGPADVFTASAVVLESTGASLLLFAVAVWPDRGTLLRSPWLLKLGDVSYSLYLTHYAVILALGLALHYIVPDAVFASPPLALVPFVTATTVVSLIIAYLAHRWIEVPGMRIGRYLTSRNAR